MSYASTAAKVRANKEAYPHLYCAVRGCLWKIQTAVGPNPCRKHPVAAPVEAEQANAVVVELRAIVETS